MEEVGELTMSTNHSDKTQVPPPSAKPAESVPATTAPKPVTALQAAGWLLRYVSQPLMFFVAGAALLGLLGLAQKYGWISEGGGGGTGGGATAAADVDYICPMMCTPPQKEPGRCPVCAMELVPASGGGAGGDERSVVVDPASRRVANIQTVSVKSVPMSRTIRAVGELQYDEGSLRTISAYSDGRFDKLYVDYTGAVVKSGDRLASFYSPELYSAQIEYLQATKYLNGQSSKSLAAVANANRSLQRTSRQRLIELGMTEAQIRQVDSQNEAQSRLDILAPMSGTVTEKMVVEGEYVKEGQPVFKLADLSTVWLMLELFPEDAAAVRYGQAIEAQLRSLPGRSFTGRIAFVDPDVDPKTRTVNVRVVLENEGGLLRIGEYATAEISVPMSSESESLVYDPELANKWISPRHPHIIADAPGSCPLCGEKLVSAKGLGFTDQPQIAANATVVPRNAVLLAAGESVVYVEEEPGRFAIRRVITGSTSGSDIVIERGLVDGEKVATGGNFLLDSQMQLAGNPSLIDPTRATEPMEMIPGFDAKMLAAIQMLPDEEQQPALEQVICPVTKYKLGSMGVPPKAIIDGKAIYLCCEGCREGLMEDPQGYLTLLQTMKAEGTLLEQVDDSDEMSFPELPEFGAIQPIATDDNAPPIGDIQMLPQIELIEPPSESSTTNDGESGRTQL